MLLYIPGAAYTSLMYAIAAASFLDSVPCAIDEWLKARVTKNITLTTEQSINKGHGQDRKTLQFSPLSGAKALQSDLRFRHMLDFFG